MFMSSFAMILSSTNRDKGVLQMINTDKDFSFLRRLSTGLMLCFTLTGAVAVNAADSASLNGWTITSGPIKTSPSGTTPNAKQVQGSFKLKNTDSPESSRRTGACLAVDLTAQGVGLPSCTTHKQCNDAYAASPNSILGSGIPGPYLYCLGDGANDSAKRCWIRPGPDTTHCNKSLHTPGNHTVPATGTVAADPLGKNESLNWVVYGCLNPDNNLPPACMNSDSTAKVNSLGKLKKVQP